MLEESDIEDQTSPIRDAVKEFLDDYFKDPDDLRPRYTSIELQFDDPKLKDVSNLQSGSYNLMNVRVTPRDDDTTKNNYHVLVGKTDIHITGKAADVIDKILNSKEG